MSDSDQSDQPRDRTLEFIPKFDDKGLLTAVVVDANSKDILMVAHMNMEALERTQASGFAYFYSRSRQTLWKKGETSGNHLRVKDILVDCDQDAVVVMAEPAGPSCHTGADSCFFRRLDGDTLVRVKS